MELRFRLYKVLTSVTMVISSFFVFTGLMSVFALAQAPLQLLLLTMAWGSCFIHSILSLFLQRSILVPEEPLRAFLSAFSADG